jgi:hypothetical protein
MKMLPYRHRKGTNTFSDHVTIEFQVDKQRLFKRAIKQTTMSQNTLANDYNKTLTSHTNTILNQLDQIIIDCFRSSSRSLVDIAKS